MKKKVLAVLVAAAIFCPAAVYAAEPAAQEETENSGETAPAEAGSAESENDGMTEEQVAALVDSVKHLLQRIILRNTGLRRRIFR